MIFSKGSRWNCLRSFPYSKADQGRKLVYLKFCKRQVLRKKNRFPEQVLGT